MSTDTDLGPLIEQQVTFDHLPNDVQRALGYSRDVYRDKVIDYGVQHQLRWSASLVKQVMPNERDYYMMLVRHSREKLMLYPHHLSDVMIKGLRVTPFSYYIDIIIDLMVAEHSYDTMPNFTAADGVRLLGIGRNQYIDTVNSWRGKGFQFKSKRKAVRELLPRHPVDMPFEYWWHVCIGYVTEDDATKLSRDAKAVVDRLIDAGPIAAGSLDRAVVQELYRRQLVYLVVPVADTDKVTVPPLEGFVMNRVLGDYFETLMYKVFVSIDERHTVGELASLLDVSPAAARNAISLFLRLGFVKKKTLPLAVYVAGPSTPVGAIRCHASWQAHTPKFASPADPSQRVAAVLPQPPSSAGASTVASAASAASDAVAGATTTAAAAAAAATATTMPTRSTDADGDAGTDVLTQMRAVEVSGAALVHLASSCNSDRRVGFLFDSTLTAFLMMGNLSQDLKKHAVTLFEVGKLTDEGLDEFLRELDKVQLPEGDDNNNAGEAQRYFEHAIILRATIRFLRQHAALRALPGCDGGLDLLRCESLHSLDAATRARVLQRHYAVLLSMTPMATETPGIATVAPPHFGPSARDLTCPWFRLYLYVAAGAGPLSLLFVKGERVSVLPPAFADVARVAMIAWDRDPIDLNTAHLLPYLNDALLSSPVLLQALAADPVAAPDVDLPFPPAKDEPASIAELRALPVVQRVTPQLFLQESIGFLRLRRTTPDADFVPVSVHYGVPLFDAALNRAVLQAIDDNALLTPKALTQLVRNNSMLSLRLLHFVQTQREPYPLDLDGTARDFPSRSLLFDGHSLCEYASPWR